MSDNSNKGEMLIRIAELEQKNAELVAQAELLRDAAQKLSFEIACDTSDHNFKGFARLQDVLAATPTQCLSQVKADSHKAGFIMGCEYAGDGFCSDADLNHYAERVKAGEV
jgi:hypothetical protein